MAHDPLPEQLGRFFQDNGLPRMAGRVFGFLLVCDPPEQTFDSLVQGLGASRSTVSVTSRLLIQLGLIERFSTRGERQDRYRLSPGAWTRILQQDIDSARSLKSIAEDALQRLARQPAGHRARLTEMARFYAFVETAYAPMLDRWHRASEAGGRTRRKP